jgi:cobalamin biosynthesis Co2+ chelatase CbiK
MKITAIHPLDYDIVWKDIKEYMEGAAKYTHGRFTANDIYNELSKGNQQLWIAYDDKVYGAVITEIIAYPQMKTLIMHFTGGVELPKWKDEMLAILRKFAKDHQCKVIESYGRSGWKRIFKNDGFNSKFMFYELPI